MALNRRSRPLALHVFLVGACALFPWAGRALPSSFRVQSWLPTLGEADLVFMQQSQANGFAQGAQPLARQGSLRFVRPTLGVAFDYAWRPLLWQGTNGERVAIVQDRLQTTLGAVVGITRWLELGISVPVSLWQQSDSLDEILYHGAGTIPAAAVGDVLLQAKLPLLQRAGNQSGFGIALASQLTLPSATKWSWMGAGQATVHPSLIIDYHLRNAFLFSIQAGFDYRPDMVLRDETLPGSRITFRWGISIPISTSNWSLFGGGLTLLPVSLHDRPSLQTVGAEFVSGVRFSHPIGVSAVLGGAVGAICIPETPGFRLFAGVSWNIEATVRHAPRPPEPQRPTQPPTVRPPSMVIQTDVGQKEMPFHDIFFVTDSHTIAPSQIPGLLGIAVHLNQQPNGGLITIRGCADIRGTEAYNKQLSTRRAQAVYDFLVEHGVPARRLRTAGLGVCGRPVLDQPETEMDSNRRVEILKSQ